MEDPRDRLVRYLAEAQATHAGVASLLEASVNEMANSDVRAMMEQRLLEAKDQALRLERRLRELGGQPSDAKNFFETVMGRVEQMMHTSRDANDRTTQDVIKAYGAVHMAVGVVTALAAYAEAYGDHDTAALAEKLMQEESAGVATIRPYIASCAADTFSATMQRIA